MVLALAICVVFRISERDRDALASSRSVRTFLMCLLYSMIRILGRGAAGCASYESLELEMMVAGRGWQAATYKKRADRTLY